jgi:hypothetical protein
MLLALTGIAGVCFGALLNAGWTYAMARRAERRELRTAARLLLPELLRNVERLESAFQTGSWSHAQFETRQWESHEVEFMSSLKGEWVELVQVYTAFDLLNRDRKIREEEGRRERITDDGDDFDYFELTLKAAGRTTGALKKVAGLAPSETLRIQEVFGV